MRYLARGHKTHSLGVYQMRMLCITWAPVSRRMDELADEFGALRWDCSMMFRAKFAVPVRYAAMAVKTLLKLSRTKPHVVIAQNPPIFLALACLFYRAIARCKLVIDHHCIWSEKSIKNFIAKAFVALVERTVSSRVDLNISPNDAWTRRMKELGIQKCVTVIDYVREVRASVIDRRSYRTTKYLAVFPSGGHPDERQDLAMQATQRIQDLTLVVTGDKRYLSRFLQYSGERVLFPGFLPNGEYFGLLTQCDFVLNVTDELNTVPHFLYEAVALEKPIISSAARAIKDIFGDQICLVKKNTAESVEAAIRDLLQDLHMWRMRSGILKKKLYERRRAEVNALRLAIASSQLSDWR